MKSMARARAAKRAAAVVLAMATCVPVGGYTIEIKGGKRASLNGKTLDLTDGKWHTGSNGYGGSDSSSYRYVTLKTPDGEKHCVVFRDSGGAGGMNCWDKQPESKGDTK